MKEEGSESGRRCLLPDAKKKSQKSTLYEQLTLPLEKLFPIEESRR